MFIIYLMSSNARYDIINSYLLMINNNVCGRQNLIQFPSQIN